MQVLGVPRPSWGVTLIRLLMGTILVVAGAQKVAGGVDRFAGFLAQAGIPAAPGVG